MSDRPTADDLHSVYESEVKSAKNLAECFNRIEQDRYEIQKKYERRDMQRIHEAGERMKAWGMDEFEIFDFKLRMGAFNISRIRPPQVINILD